MLTKMKFFTLLRLCQQKNSIFSLFVSANKSNVFTRLHFLHTLLSPACGVLCLADLPTSKKFTYTTLANSLHSRPHFILNRGVGVAMFLFFFLSLSLSDIPFILYSRLKCTHFATQLSSLLP